MNFGIICEFNPFHAGHKYLFDAARERGARNIVCAMSGNSVQRGELAIFDKYIRARGAIESGADLVLELPFPWSSASAQYFAAAGVKALAPYCDALIFGSECGDIDLLKKAAEYALTYKFIDELETRKMHGERAAEAYFSMIEKYLGTSLSSNDILGVEYIKAAKRCGADLEFYTVKRMGSAYRDNDIHEGAIPSASAIRGALRSGDADGLLRAKQYTDGSLDEAIRANCITDPALLERAVLMYFRLCEPSEISCYAECDGGVAERICSAAREASDYESFWRLVRTKRYTDAKMSRAILFALARVKEELLEEYPEYLYLLAANDNGRGLLSSVKRSGADKGITVVTKPADAPRDTAQFKAEDRLNAIFSLARANASSVGDEYRKNAFITK